MWFLLIAQSSAAAAGVLEVPAGPCSILDYCVLSESALNMTSVDTFAPVLTPAEMELIEQIEATMRCSACGVVGVLSSPARYLRPCDLFDVFCLSRNWDECNTW